MSVKKFCNGCKHLNVDPMLKSMFNKVVQETFIVCPVNEEELISGCLIKNLEIDWESFVKYCSDNGYLTENKE